MFLTVKPKQQNLTEPNTNISCSYKVIIGSSNPSGPLPSRLGPSLSSCCESVSHPQWPLQRRRVPRISAEGHLPLSFLSLSAFSSLLWVKRVWPMWPCPLASQWICPVGCTSRRPKGRSWTQGDILPHTLRGHSGLAAHPSFKDWSFLSLYLSVFCWLLTFKD